MLTTAGLARSTATTTGVRRGLAGCRATNTANQAIMDKKSGARRLRLSTLTRFRTILTLAAARYVFHQTRLLRGPGGRPQRRWRGNQEGLPQAGPPVSS